MIKLIKRRQPKGPWWFCVVDDGKIGIVARYPKLDQKFRKWVADCHLAGLHVDLITEKYARRLIEQGWYEPTIKKFKEVQPTGPWLIGCFDGDKPKSGCLINVFDDVFRDWAIERNVEGLRLELVK